MIGTLSERASVNVILKVSDGVKVSADDSLELTLNCFICQRTRRTVILDLGKETGICTPTKHLFPAKILTKDVRSEAGVIEINYLIEYWFASFVDSKYKESAENVLTWGRVSFQITCPKCSKTNPSSIQNNTVRPWTYFCSCGQPLYFETEEYPKFEKNFN